eukprot:scaffold3426_cov145-Amphora_coffeaeformis.AAC.3
MPEGGHLRHNSMDCWGRLAQSPRPIVLFHNNCYCGWKSDVSVPSWRPKGAQVARRVPKTNK